MKRDSNVCAYCSKPTINPKFCNRSCSSSYNNKVKPRRQLGMHKCFTCNTPVRAGRKFCEEHTPYGRFLNLTIGEVCGKRNYQINSQIRNMARAAYKSSGRPVKCLICHYDKFVHICHIKDIYTHDSSDTIARVNSQSNLIALCPNHHAEFDNDML